MPVWAGGVSGWPMESVIGSAERSASVVRLRYVILYLLVLERAREIRHTQRANTFPYAVYGFGLCGGSIIESRVGGIGTYSELCACCVSFWAFVCLSVQTFGVGTSSDTIFIVNETFVLLVWLEIRHISNVGGHELGRSLFASITLECIVSPSIWHKRQSCDAILLCYSFAVDFYRQSKYSTHTRQTSSEKRDTKILPAHSVQFGRRVLWLLTKASIVPFIGQSNGAGIVSDI